MRRNQWLASVGVTGWNGSEPPAGCVGLRNLPPTATPSLAVFADYIMRIGAWRGRGVSKIIFLMLFALVFLGVSNARSAGLDRGPVPFVGCVAEGMSGPEAAPTRSARTPLVPATAASKLAHYAAAGMDVLAPRGWHCIEIYGSGGAVLLVTPGPHSADELQRFGQIAGPVVELSYLNGRTSGRFDVARIFARLFPSKRPFVRQVIQEHIEPAARFPFGPFPADTLIRRGRSEVDFTTPPGRLGMGTLMDRLGPAADPVIGMVRLASQDGLMLLDVRLPASLRPLASEIIRFARQE